MFFSSWLAMKKAKEKNENESSPPSCSSFFNLARKMNEETALIASDDPGGVLAAVLQNRQGVIKILIDASVGNQPHDSAHVRP